MASKNSNLNVTLLQFTHFPTACSGHSGEVQLTYLNIPTALEGGVRLHCIRAVAESEDGGE